MYHVVTVIGVGSTVRIDGLTISGGRALGSLAQERQGAGVLAQDASPTIVQCTFVDNRAFDDGGAMRVSSASVPQLEPLVVNSSFLRNTADQGGAVSAVGTPPPVGQPARVAAPLFVNCVFSGNDASPGSAGYSGIYSRLVLANCTVNSNEGTALFAVDVPAGSGLLVVNNSIVWNNTPGQISGPAIVNYSDIQGGFDGPGNIDMNPGFRNELGPDLLPGTADDDVRLNLASLATDAGNNARVPPDNADLDGDANVSERTPLDRAFVGRIGLSYNNAPSACLPAVDMGAFESSDCQPNGTPDDEELAGNDDDGNGVPDDCQDCNGNGKLDFIDIKEGTSYDCNGNGVPDECDVGDECSRDAEPDGVPDECQLIWQLRAPFVDPRAPGAGAQGVEGAAASLINGKIYVSHGNRGATTGNPPNDTKLLSIYDFASDTWTHGGTLAPDASLARSELGAGTALGKHYAIGGRVGNGASNQVEEFNPTGPAWTPKEPMGVARAGLGVASWNDLVYAIGGRTGATFGGGTILGANAVYDPASNTWTSLAPLQTPQEAVSDNYATIAFDGRIYVFGGARGSMSVTTAVQVYDILANSWSFGAPLPTLRAAAMAGVVEGMLAVFGGFDPDPTVGTNLTVTELYDPVTDRWYPGPAMYSAASEMAQGVVWDETGVYAVGSGIFGAGGVQSTFVQRLVPRSACLADINGNGVVDTQDWLALLQAWGPCPAPPDPCPADFDGNGEVDVRDFNYLLANWGDCPDPESGGSGFSAPQGQQSETPSLPEALNSTGLVWPADLQTFIDCMTDGSLAEQENCLCWMAHYLQGCMGLLCLPPPCPGDDPFSNPPPNHGF